MPNVDEKSLLPVFCQVLKVLAQRRFHEADFYMVYLSFTNSCIFSSVRCASLCRGRRQRKKSQDCVPEARGSGGGPVDLLPRPPPPAFHHFFKTRDKIISECMRVTFYI